MRDETTPRPENVKALLALREQGLTFGECIEAFGVDREENKYATAAYVNLARDGELEFDDVVVVSGRGPGIAEGMVHPSEPEEEDADEGEPDAGAYVLGWVWVSAHELTKNNW